MKVFVAVCCLVVLSSVAFAQSAAAPEIVKPSDAFALSRMLPGPQLPASLGVQRATILTIVQARTLSSAEVMPMMGGSTCLKMRSYIFKRQRDVSDAVRLSGERDCTPAKQFQFKTAK